MQIHFGKRKERKAAAPTWQHSYNPPPKPNTYKVSKQEAHDILQNQLDVIMVRVLAIEEILIKAGLGERKSDGNATGR